MNKFHPNWKSLSDCTKCGEFMGHGHECGGEMSEKDARTHKVLIEPMLCLYCGELTSKPDVQHNRCPRCGEMYPESWDVITLAAKLDALRSELAAAQKEVERLTNWKREASEVLNQLQVQEVGKELNVPLGTPVAPAVLSGIRSLKAEVERLTESYEPFRKELEEVAERAERSEQREQTMRQALERLMNSVNKLSIADASHRSKLRCSESFPLNEWAEVGNAIVAAQKVLHTEEPHV